MRHTGSVELKAARDMLDAFISVGANRFHVTFTNLSEDETGFLRNRTVPSMRYNLPGWMERAARLTPVTLPATEKYPEQTALAGENLILRPYTPPAVVLVQLDDLNPEQLKRVRPAVFLLLQTSPGNYQAWAAVEGGDREFTSRVKRTIGADLSASGSVRLAGTTNYKRKYLPDFPTVALEEAKPGHIMTRDALERWGLADAGAAGTGKQERKEPPASPLRCSDGPKRLAWPDWNLCLEEMLARGKKRSAADYYFACIASDRYKRTPEEIADKLMELSSKARENGYEYALGQAMRAAEAVARNPYARSR